MKSLSRLENDSQVMVIDSESTLTKARVASHFLETGFSVACPGR